MTENNKEIDYYHIGETKLKEIEQKSNKIKAAEIYIDLNRYMSIEIEENAIKNSEIGTENGISMRLFDKRGSLGFAYTNRFEKSTLDMMLKNAFKMMNAGTSDPDFKDLPSHYDNYPNVKSLYNKNIENFAIEEASQYVADLIQVCDEDELAISQSATFKTNYSETYIFNTNGVETIGKKTIASISSNIIVKDDSTGETSSGFERQSVRNLRELNVKDTAIRALEDAKQNLNRQKISNMKVPVVLTPKGTANLILSPLASAINAERFQYKRSFLVGKRGKKIGSSMLTVEDNALIDGATGSSIFDDEGVPGKDKMIVDEGRFLENGLLHNSYTASKEGITSTGNAVRSSYNSTPSISSTNFILKTGEHSKEEMIHDIKTGILFDYTGDSPNMATGDFSGLILHGNLIKNGEISHSLNETMFGINLINLFKNITAISKDYKVYGSFWAPYVKIEEMQIIGSA
jgi:PmbA protein